MTTYTGTPKTWAAGERLTAAAMNEEVRDPLTALVGSWNSYTPALTGFTQGNGTLSGYYMQVGKLVVFYCSFVFGSSSTAGTSVSLSVPVTRTGIPLLQAYFVDSSASAVYVATAHGNTSTTVAMGVPGTNGLRAQPSTTSPFTWATGDGVYVSGLIQAA